MSAVLAMEFAPESPQVNWHQVFNDMKERGFSYFRVGEAIGKTGSTVQRWRTGVEPPHLIGERILRLHATICGEDLNQRRRRGE